ncbi:hypothetical protein GYMLUDRAFT_64621 [Collybiopsis luxurians FD-317 M1]|uniref:Uncharacterized protein n=1 Tax=Collybiopsis luxurians FD-317 M1 TaxID=944289 RepID=A0A0D0ANJ2_9AGAR|nr:hypothetical protein GYMLUDRAFT_64621 [Collybiopsis luxurians FD-317 M1]
MRYTLCIPPLQHAATLLNVRSNAVSLRELTPKVSEDESDHGNELEVEKICDFSDGEKKTEVDQLHPIPDTDMSGWYYITSKLQKQYPAGKPALHVCSQASTILELLNNEQAVEMMKKMGIKVIDYTWWRGKSHSGAMEGVLQPDSTCTLLQQEISQQTQIVKAHCH